MGYDLERFVGPVNDGLLCCICRDVLEDPVQAPCEHAYCRLCIEGWLVQETRCPEDRHSLSVSQLKPLFRYMRNDLSKLQIRCINQNLGCTYAGDLELIGRHESDCPVGTVRCPNEKCSLSLARKDLSDHLKICKFHAKECVKGCGMLMETADDKRHNCITELRTALDILRSEMFLKTDEKNREMEMRLNMQRCHMVQKEATMQAQIDSLKSEMAVLSQKVKYMMDIEMERRQDIERLELEKKELMELLRGSQRPYGSMEEPPKLISTSYGYRGKVTSQFE